MHRAPCQARRRCAPGHCQEPPPPPPFVFHLHAAPCRVFLCAREWENPLTGEALDISDGSSTSSVIKAANLVALHADGAASLADGSRIEGVDVVMFCTGYE